MGCRLFNHMCSEDKGLRDEVKDSIYEAAKLIVDMEHNYIDKIFEMGDLDNLKKDDLKEFITKRVNEKLAEQSPGIYYPMGMTAEVVAKRYDVSRETQDEIAFESQKRTAAAQEAAAGAGGGAGCSGSPHGAHVEEEAEDQVGTLRQERCQLRS